MHPSLRKIVKFFASLKLAVVIILGMAVISAIGTITEARYNEAEYAQKIVYQSWWMYGVLTMLAITLIAVMIDRWPWKQHHVGFVLAHVGILILLLGSWMTKEYGIDGSMAFQVGEERRFVAVHDRDFYVYASFDGSSMKEIFGSPVDFLRNPPSEKKPFVVHLGADELKVTDYLHFAYRESEITHSKLENDGPAVRFQLENPNVNLTQWLRRENRRSDAELDLGPAKVVLTDRKPEPSGRNEVILITKPRSDDLDYIIYNKDKSVRKKGTVKQAETVETGWMGMKFRLLRYLPHSREEVRFTKAPAATPVTTQAIKFAFKDQTYWLGSDSIMRLYTDDKMYIVSFGRRQVELAFPLKLVNFKIGNYQGTQRAASYESEVEVPGRGLVNISMNEPLKWQGFTFYQSSFEKNEKGEPTVSVLSVNHDPGRWVKYLGSLSIVLGSIALFYFKRTQWFKKRKPTK
jgi:hypothetical protein